MRQPLAYATQLTLTTRVRASQALSRASRTGVPPSVRTRRISTPREIKLSQGYWLDGNSLSGRTALSPSFQGKPSATSPMPAVVLGTRAISSPVA